MKRFFQIFYSSSSVALFAVATLAIASVVVAPCAAVALTADEYAEEVLRKDLPRSLAWLQRISTTTPIEPIELQHLYNSVLPQPQSNWHSGISVKGSIERMLLLLEGAAFFPAVRGASVQYQTAKARVQHILQAAKDQTDHFKFGEKPEVLHRQWQELGVGDFASFASELELVLKETQKLLAPKAPAVPEPQDMPSTELVQTTGVPAIAEQTSAGSSVDVEGVIELASGLASGAGSASGSVTVSTSKSTSGSVASPITDPAALDDYDREAKAQQQNKVNATSPIDQTMSPPVEEFEQFDIQRFFAYVESSEAGRIAPECVSARAWSTDATSRCQSDDENGCDRKYARQCKKLH